MASIISLPFIKLVISRNNNYTVNHQSGTDNVPHLCVKVKHSNGYAWFGIIIVDYEKRTSGWTEEEFNAVVTRFHEAMNSQCDIQRLETDINRLMDSIQDVVTGRKRPTLFGGDGNDFIQMHLQNNIQLDIYRNEINEDTLTYGGYRGKVSLRHGYEEYNFFLYHRGIILNHYIDAEIAKELIEDALNKTFPEITYLPRATVEPTAVERTRNRHLDKS
ncbi:hypothetical protein fnug_337 [Pseudomonas phage fnug]|uniref:Uncharacterized protein n=2 Tax=Phikzvirus phiKZ TaxID=169683 RepID=A0A192Y5C7_9CAUD|nr:hypothetical protein KTN4_346 [Pseudomonas phage KTN4]QJB22980.1 hypothetical protein fnug_337 [Pseudomonas phage fnug]UXD83317.1 hypothetical protein NP274_00265 [Pseudomonas phage Koomba boorn-mokiny kep-wari Wadjak 1]